MQVNGQLKNAQLELSDDSQTSQYKGRVTYNQDSGNAVLDTGSDLVCVQDTRDHPAGSLLFWPSEVSPGPRYLKSEGQTVLVADYPELFAILGDRYGGDGITDFALPDYRGCFFRSTDNGRGKDSGAATRQDRGDGTTGDAVGTTQTLLVDETDADYTFPNTNIDVYIKVK